MSSLLLHLPCPKLLWAYVIMHFCRNYTLADNAPMGICHYAFMNYSSNYGMTRYMSFRKQLDRSREPLRETMGAFQS